MTEVKTITATTTESAIEFDSFYKFVWLKNMGNADCYVSDQPNIVADADGVSILKAGETVRINMTDDSVYIKAASGTSDIEAHAQIFSDCPFRRMTAGSGGGGTITIDTNPTQGSPNAVSSGGTYTAIQSATAVRTLLYTSNDITQGAPYQTDVNLLDNLNKYDLIMILYVADSTTGNESCGTGIYDVSELLTTGYGAHFAGYYCRWSAVTFTNTTFNQTGRGATYEGDQYAPQIYKIYGYKL